MGISLPTAGRLSDVGPRLPRGNLGVLRPGLGLCSGVRAILKGNFMDFEYLLGAALTVALTIYLVYALVRPEHF